MTDSSDNFVNIHFTLELHSDSDIHCYTIFLFGFCIRPMIFCNFDYTILYHIQSIVWVKLIYIDLSPSVSSLTYF